MLCNCDLLICCTSEIFLCANWEADERDWSLSKALRKCLECIRQAKEAGWITSDLSVFGNTAEADASPDYRLGPV